MKKVILTSGLAVVLALPAVGWSADYQMDTSGAHSSVNFKVSHLGYGFIKGRFNEFTGSFSYDPSNLTASKVMVTVDTGSLDSNHAERDKHLRSSDFIDAREYPEATFVSTSVTSMAGGKLKIAGDLTLHGMTKPFTIDAEIIGEGNDPWGNYRAGFSGTGRIELADYGVKVMGSSSYVDLELYVEGIRQ